MRGRRTARLVTLVGYWGLWCLLPAWYIWLAPSSHLPISVVLGFLLFPLLFPLPGLIRGTAYTYAWSSMLSLLYFTHGVGEAWTWHGERLYGLLEIALSLAWFSGAIAYVRTTRRRESSRPDSQQT